MSFANEKEKLLSNYATRVMHHRWLHINEQGACSKGIIKMLDTQANEFDPSTVLSPNS